MAGNNTAVFGIFRDRRHVEVAIDEFKRAGFRPNDISVLFPETDSTKEFAHEKHTKAPEGAATGAGTGAVLGGTLGWLVGIGALAIPGLGPFIAAGPIMAALAGAGVGGAVGGRATTASVAPTRVATSPRLSVLMSALASPVESTSAAPRCLKISLARSVHSRLSECTDTRMPPFLRMPS